ncbi:MAG TPA: hypothetical protein VFU93_06580 [Acidimicrobiales bacterium]|nr:hypothetical protein [Acidimicrobiales bacterium]
MTDDVEVVLLDDAGPTTRTVQLRPRRRGRELVLVAAAIAAVVGVGLVGGDDDEDAGASPTTTTSERRSTTTRARTATTRRPALAQPTTTRRPTTTTTWPQLEAGSGPLLPDADADLRLAVLHGNGVVTVASVHTGDRCRMLLSTNGAYVPWEVTLPVDGLLAQTDTTIHVVDRACAMRELFDVRDSYPVAVGPDRAWMASGSGQRILERALPSGDLTGRSFDLPRYTFTTVVALGDALVVGASGEMTLVDPTTDERRSLGPGTPLAVHGTRLALVECPELRCRLAVVDVASGERRTYADVEPGAWDRSHFSADGRLLRVPVAGRDEYQPSTAVVDLETGTSRVFDEPLMRTAFTPDGRWLVGQAGSGALVAHDLLGGAGRVELLPEIRDVQGFALL